MICGAATVGLCLTAALTGAGTSAEVLAVVGAVAAVVGAVAAVAPLLGASADEEQGAGAPGAASKTSAPPTGNDPGLHITGNRNTFLRGDGNVVQRNPTAGWAGLPHLPPRRRFRSSARAPMASARLEGDGNTVVDGDGNIVDNAAHGE